MAKCTKPPLFEDSDLPGFEAKPDLPKLSASTYYDMQKYSQYVIDAVQNIEDDIDEMTKEQKGAISYRLKNVLEIINPERREDVEALGILIKILDYEN